MTRSYAGLASSNWGSLWFGFVCGAALLSGCAAPAQKESAPPPGRSAQTAAPAAAPAPAAPQAAKQTTGPKMAEPAKPPTAGDSAQSPPKAAATGEIAEADFVGKDGSMSPADQEALAELIRLQVMAARSQQAGAESDSKAPEAKASPAVAARREESRAEVIPTLSSPAPDAGSDGSTAAGGARMELSPMEFDFKEVWQGMPAEGEFTIKNAGLAPLVLDTRSSCGCTVATKPKSPLEPGETTHFKISYNTSHAGAAQKTVTVTTNDPEHPSAVIKVTGKVKPLVAATPSDRIAFSDLETDSVESRTVQLESQYDQPLNLTLRENPNPGPFEAELKELEAGKRYELTVTTKPPLQQNMNSSTVVIETGIEKAPIVSVYLTANVPPQVAVMPARLTVRMGSKQPAQQLLQVNYRADTPVEITDVKSSSESVKWEILPAEPPAADAKMRTYRVRVMLPPYDELPDAGATLQIFTSATEEQYKHFDVPMIKLRAPTPPAARVAPAAPVPPAAPPAKS